MTEAKTNPSEKPKTILQIIKPRATKLPIERIPLIKEKSFRVMKTVAVIPSTSNKVINPAVGIKPLPPYIVAIKRRGRKTIASAITNNPSPKYDHPTKATGHT